MWDVFGTSEHDVGRLWDVAVKRQALTSTDASLLQRFDWLSEGHDDQLTHITVKESDAPLFIPIQKLHEVHEMESMKRQLTDASLLHRFDWLSEAHDDQHMFSLTQVMRLCLFLLFTTP